MATATVENNICGELIDWEVVDVGHVSDGPLTGGLKKWKDLWTPQVMLRRIGVGVSSILKLDRPGQYH